MIPSIDIVPSGDLN